MTGRVLAIYIADMAKAPMYSVPSAKLEAGRGIPGDRYYARIGSFSEQSVTRPDREVTLIESEQVDDFNRSTGLGLDYGAPRRNIVTTGIRLNELVGVRFSVGDAVLEGIRLCEPCKHLAALVHEQILPGLVHRAGLRARIVSGATIKPSDRIVTT
jgi:hypothetical protein